MTYNAVSSANILLMFCFLPLCQKSAPFFTLLRPNTIWVVLPLWGISKKIYIYGQYFLKTVQAFIAGVNTARNEMH